MRENTIFWDVDTQCDFMLPQGALYVPGAEAIIDVVSDARKLALEAGYSLLADTDWHSMKDGEISLRPDFKSTFPPHCIAGEKGSERVGFLGTMPIDYVPVERVPDDELRRMAGRQQFHIVIRKNTLDVFDNPNTARLIHLITPGEVFVFGVALDFCVYYCLRGLARRKGIRLHLLSDAVKGLGTKPDAELLDEFMKMGVEVVTLAEVKERLNVAATR